ncbi:MAG: SDR family oxidoreductase [Oligoflexia bacterium]|nr:SDR family oxidoreductase [Oligoflexia bacterium]
MKKLVFVTGMGRGIGRVIALKLAAEGYSVSGCARTLDELQETKKLSGGKINITTLDIRDYKSIENWMTKECQATDATPWGLVTAAGIHGPVGTLIENSWEDWQNAVDINLFGTVMSVKIFTEILTEKKLPGRIVLLSGGGATKPIPNVSSYCATKAGVVRFGETVAKELRPFNITVNSIAPGAVNTKLTEEILNAGPEKAGKEFYDNTVKQIKQGGANPEISAELVSYLFGPKGGVVTGKLIASLWDEWANFHEWADKLDKSEIYTLRRILPEDRLS